jgi:glycosyltransferase involved in cell wall biosynthesis
MITFISHFRGDTEYRYRNLKNVISYYGNLYPNSEHIIINDAEIPDERLKEFANNRVKFYFFENPSDYRRCECYNIGIKNASFPFVVFLDLDVLVSKVQIDSCLKGLIDGIVHFVYPYDGRFVDIIDHDLIPSFVDNFIDITKKFEEILPKLELNVPHSCGLNLIHTQSVGGIQISTKQFMTDVRGFVSSFLSWGCEDLAMFYLYQKMGFKVGRVGGCVYHMNHTAKDSIRENNPHYQNNVAILTQILEAGPEELQKIANSWRF